MNIKINKTGRSSKKIWLLSIAVILAVIVVITKYTGNGRETVKPVISPVVEAVYALGTVKSDRSVNIRFGMNSVITRFYVREGDSVSKGTLLLETDSSVAFRSPIDGVVTTKNYNENEVVPAGQAVITITDMKTLYVRVSLDQESIITVKKGMKAEISFENLRNLKVYGVVESIYQTGGEFVVRIKVPVMPEMVLPEMTCDTAIIIREKPDAILIPANSVINDTVRIKRNKEIKTVSVKTRAVENGMVEVIQGDIRPDDLVFNIKAAKAPKKNSNNDPGFR